MDADNRATKITWFDFKSPQMRAFHLTWLAFFLCFFAWFGIAPLMAVVKGEFHLTKAQIGLSITASVTITVLVRLLMGWLCDKIGPRLSYTFLLVFGSIPVMAIGFAQDYASFLFFRLMIGVIGASFVITQYHASVMFAPNVVGTANAVTAGWGNLGGGVTNMVMPLVFAAFMGWGFSNFVSWRLSMIVAGGVCLLVGIAYFSLTQDTPNGNFKDLRKAGKMPPAKAVKGTFALAARDYRVWVLFLIYGACFGIELTIDNLAALYYAQDFHLDLAQAGLIAGLFGLMNIFARAFGGVLGDRFGNKFGLRGRVWFLMVILFLEGLALIAFSRMTILPAAIAVMTVFSLFVQMSCGATFAVVPFLNRKALGAVSGIVGAGGNAGAVMAGLLIAVPSMTYSQSLLVLGVVVSFIALLAPLVRFSKAQEHAASEETRQALNAALVTTSEV